MAFGCPRISYNYSVLLTENFVAVFYDEISVDCLAAQGNGFAPLAKDMWALQCDSTPPFLIVSLICGWGTCFLKISTSNSFYLPIRTMQIWMFSSTFKLEEFALESPIPISFHVKLFHFSMSSLQSPPLNISFLEVLKSCWAGKWQGSLLIKIKSDKQTTKTERILQPGWGAKTKRNHLSFSPPSTFFFYVQAKSSCSTALDWYMNTM